MSDEVRKRLAVAAVGIPLCVAVVYAGALATALGLALLAAQGMKEYVTIFRSGGERPFLAAGVVAAAAFPLATFAAGPALAWQAVAGLLMALAFGALLVDAPEEGPVKAAAVTLVGVLYVGGLLAFAVPLRAEFTDGRLAGTALFFLPVGVTWLTDTSAYFGGRAWGRRPLAPRVSPNKTVEGAAAGLVAGVAGGYLYGVWLLGAVGEGMTPLPAAALGLLVAVAAIAGDLVESVLKRECGVKDSSDLLPGHGGLLDRMDSLLWVFPVTYLFLRIA